MRLILLLFDFKEKETCRKEKSKNDRQTTTKIPKQYQYRLSKQHGGNLTMVVLQYIDNFELLRLSDILMQN